MCQPQSIRQPWVHQLLLPPPLTHTQEMCTQNWDHLLLQEPATVTGATASELPETQLDAPMTSAELLPNHPRRGLLHWTMRCEGNRSPRRRACTEAVSNAVRKSTMSLECATEMAWGGGAGAQRAHKCENQNQNPERVWKGPFLRCCGAWRCLTGAAGHPGRWAAFFWCKNSDLTRRWHVCCQFSGTVSQSLSYSYLLHTLERTHM